MDYDLVGWRLQQLLQDRGEDDADDLIERLAVLYDVLVPPTPKVT